MRRKFSWHQPQTEKDERTGEGVYKVITTRSQMFKKEEKKMKIRCRDTKDIKRPKSSQTSRDKNYKVWDKK
jgi:hypothetical protein